MMRNVILILASALILTGFTKNVSAKEFVFGVVPQQSPLVIYQKWTPVVQYLSEKTGLTVRLRTEKSIAAFEQAVYNGVYDLAYMNPYHYVVAHDKQGYQAVSKRAKDIRGILIGRNDSRLQDINAESRFLFPSPNAFAATLVLKYELLKQFGLDFKQSKNLSYVNSHDSVYKGVARNFGDLGGGVQRTFRNFSAEADKSKLKILYLTKPYPSHPFAIKSSVPEQERMLLRDALLAMPVELLTNLSMKQMMPVRDKDYDVIRELSKRLQTVEDKVK